MKKITNKIKPDEISALAERAMDGGDNMLAAVLYSTAVAMRLGHDMVTDLALTCSAMVPVMERDLELMKAAQALFGDLYPVGEPDDYIW